MNQTTQWVGLVLGLLAVPSLAGAPSKEAQRQPAPVVKSPKKKSVPPPKVGTAETPSSRECQTYLSRLVELQSAESVGALPEVQSMNEKERAATLARVTAESAKLPEAQRELKDCLGGRISRAELDCTLQASSASAAAGCAGL